MHLGVLDRLREIAGLPEGDHASLHPHEAGHLLNRARRLAREALLMLEDEQQRHDKHERPNSPAYVPSRPPRTPELSALDELVDDDH